MDFAEHCTLLTFLSLSLAGLGLLTSKLDSSQSIKLSFLDLSSPNKCQLAHSLPCPQQTTPLFIRLSAAPTSGDKRGHQFHQIHQVEASRCHQTIQMQAMVEVMAMVDVVNKPDAEVTMPVAVGIAQKHNQSRQNFKAHVKCSKSISLIAQTTIKLTIMPPH